MNIHYKVLVLNAWINLECLWIHLKSMEIIYEEGIYSFFFFFNIMHLLLASL